MGLELQGALRTFYYAVGQDADISIPLLGRFQTEGWLSMTFEPPWRSRSRRSSGGAQMKATACATYPAILINSSRADARRSSVVLLYSLPDDLMEAAADILAPF